MIGRVYQCGGFWRVLARAEPFDTRRGGPARNVLLEALIPLGGGRPEDMVDGELGPLRVVDGYVYRATGRRIVRPFRGLRRVG